jgi:Uma2 family endonuclease
MQVDPRKKLFTVEQFYRMGEAGVFSKGERVELINGEVILMSPIGRRHAARVDRLTALFTHAFAGRAIVRVQNPIYVDEYNLPQPDIVLLKPCDDFYESAHPGPGDTLLVFEVADTSLRFDLNQKLAVYAISGVPEYWVEDVDHDEILVHRSPNKDTYDHRFTVRRGDTVSPVAFPDLVFKAEQILGGQ